MNRPLILELDDFWKGSPTRLPWGAIDDDHCIANLPQGTVIEAQRVNGEIRLIARPGEGTVVPEIDEVRPDVASLMEVVMQRLVAQADVDAVAQSAMAKGARVSALVKRIMAFGTPSKQRAAADVMREWQSGRIDGNETLRQLGEINDTVIEKNLNPLGRRSLARRR